MATKLDLCDWLVAALIENGNKGRIPELCKIVWKHHEQELKASGNLFFTWQYDIRWAATALRRKGTLKPTAVSPTGLWELA